MAITDKEKKRAEKLAKRKLKHKSLEKVDERDAGEARPAPKSWRISGHFEHLSAGSSI